MDLIRQPTCQVTTVERAASEVQSPEEITVALAGNPNTGKSTVFNSLTGLKQHTGNWPGKTVTRARGRYKFRNRGYTLIDLPGTYSLSADSAEEQIAGEFICFGKPKVTVVVADATCLERNLNLVLQVLEMTDRVVVCVNLLDEAARKGISINLSKLSDILGVPVVGTAARSGEGLPRLMDAIEEVALGNTPTSVLKIDYGEVLEEAIDEIGHSIGVLTEEKVNMRWAALRLMEGGSSAASLMNKLLEFDPQKGRRLQKRLNDIRMKLRDPGLFECESPPKGRKLSERVAPSEGRNPSGYRELPKCLGLSKGETLSKGGTPSKGGILSEEQDLSIKGGPSLENVRDHIASTIVRTAETISREVVVLTGKAHNNRFDHKIDSILMSKAFGIPVMVMLLGLVFWITIQGANVPSTLLADGLFRLEEQLFILFNGIGVPMWISDILLSGVYRTLAWVVSVMLPPMAIFFPLFTLLEDLGYLPRVAFNLDHYFKKAGAHGKQALTMCMGFGCNAAGVIACRIIGSPRERLIATITNNFVPCNGRFPILISMALILAAGVIGPSGGPSASGAVDIAAVSTMESVNGFSPLIATFTVLIMVLSGIGITLITSRVLSKTLLKGLPSSFTLELPPYRVPQVTRVIVRSVLDRTLFVLGRAVIVAAPAGLIIWVMANTGIGGISLLTHSARFLDPFARFMGLDGFILMAFVLGLPANEIVLPILIMSYTAGGVMVEPESTLRIGQLFLDNGWTWVTAVCTMIFALNHWPCGTTLLTIRKETQSWKWTWVSFLVPTVTGILLCILFAQGVKLFRLL